MPYGYELPSCQPLPKRTCQHSENRLLSQHWPTVSFSLKVLKNQGTGSLLYVHVLIKNKIHCIKYPPLHYFFTSTFPSQLLWLGYRAEGWWSWFFSSLNLTQVPGSWVYLLSVSGNVHSTAWSRAVQLALHLSLWALSAGAAQRR